MERLGTKVRAIPRDTFNQEFDRQPVTEEVRHLAAELRREAAGIVEPNEQDTLNAMRTYTTAKRLLAREQAHALSMDCLGMVEAKLVPTPPCAGGRSFRTRVSPPAAKPISMQGLVADAHQLSAGSPWIYE